MFAHMSYEVIKVFQSNALIRTSRAEQVAGLPDGTDKNVPKSNQMQPKNAFLPNMIH